FLAHGPAVHPSRRFVPTRRSSDLFLKKVFACATKAKKWFNIDLNKTSARLGTTRDRLVRAFTFLEEQGDLTLKVAGFRQGYRRIDRKSTRLNSSHVKISYAVFCLK